MELEDVLAQTPEDEVSAVLRPLGRHGILVVVEKGVISLLVNLLVCVLSWVAEDELAGPEEVLPGLPLVLGIVRVLTRCQDVVICFREPPAQAGLRDAVEEAEMLVAGQRTGLRSPFFLEDDRDPAANGETFPSRRED